MGACWDNCAIDSSATQDGSTSSPPEPLRRRARRRGDAHRQHRHAAERQRRRRRRDLYEPIHKLRADIARHGLANPCATILSAAMMLDLSLEERDARALYEGPSTRPWRGARRRHRRTRREDHEHDRDNFERDPRPPWRPGGIAEEAMAPIPEMDTIWMDGALVLRADAKVHVLTHALHFAGGLRGHPRLHNGVKGRRAHGTSGAGSNSHGSSCRCRTRSRSSTTRSSSRCSRATSWNTCTSAPLVFRGSVRSACSEMDARAGHHGGVALGRVW